MSDEPGTDSTSVFLISSQYLPSNMTSFGLEFLSIIISLLADFCIYQQVRGMSGS